MVLLKNKKQKLVFFGIFFGESRQNTSLDIYKWSEYVIWMLIYMKRYPIDQDENIIKYAKLPITLIKGLLQAVKPVLKSKRLNYFCIC